LMRLRFRLIDLRDGVRGAEFLDLNSLHDYAFSVTMPVVVCQTLTSVPFWSPELDWSSRDLRHTTPARLVTETR
jgi:hypothetical protein